MALVLFFLTFALVASDTPPASFNRLEIDPDLVGDYWIFNSDVDRDGHTDLIAIAYSGDGMFWYKNNGKRDGNSWHKYQLANATNAVAMDDAGDINGDGKFPDYVVAYNFTIPSEGGPSPIGGGTAGWLENPGLRDIDEPWTLHPIMDIPSLHRILYDKDLNDGAGAIILGPILGPTPDPPIYLNQPCQVGLLLKPKDIKTQWKYVPLSFPTPFHSIHAFVKAPQRYQEEGSLRVLVGVQEGLFSLDFPFSSSLPVVQNFLVEGAPLYPYSPYSGVNGVDVCSFRNSSYMATIGPWEGVNILTPPTIQVHTFKDLGSASLGAGGSFESKTLTIQGPQAHAIACGDFDGDGNDEFLVGMRGPVKSIQMYKAPFFPQSDDQFNIWDLNLSYNQGASGLVVGDYDKDGLLDFAATGNYPADKFVAVYYQIEK